MLLSLVAVRYACSPSSYPLNDALAEQSLRPEQQEDQRDHIGEPALDAGAEQRPPVELTDLLTEPDRQTPDDRAGDRREAAEDQHRQGLESDDLEGERHLRACAPQDAGSKRHD